MIKDLIYTGLGAATLLKERVESELKKLEEQGKIKTTDVKSFLESIETKGKEEESRFKDEIKSAIKEAIDELGIATKMDLQKLKEDLK
jgi:polyhydroxyalkanoate synthesis regulator phasin